MTHRPERKSPLTIGVRSPLTVAVLALIALLSVTPLAPAAGIDDDNPVDLYGPDGLAFTPDDILAVRGGYTNTAVMATAFGEMKDGVDKGAPDEDLFTIYLVSFSPEDNSVVAHVLCKSDDPQLQSGGAGWHPWPNLKSIPPLDAYKPENFGYNEGPPLVPDVTSQLTGSPQPYKNTSWWNGGNDLRISCLTADSWEWDGSVDTDPALKITARHFPELAKIVKDMRIEKTRFRASCISAMNQKTGDCGVASCGFLVVEGVKVVLDGRLPDFDFGVVTCELHIEGTVENSSPDLTLEIDPELFGILDVGSFDVKIVIDDSDKNPMNNPAQAMADYASSGEVHVGTVGIVNALRDTLIPPMDHLTDDDKSRISNEWAQGRGIDCLANEVVRTLMKCGRWLPWLATSDASNLVADSSSISPTGNSAIDLSDTKLSSDRTVKTQDILSASGPEVLTNNGLDYLTGDMLIYGRDSVHRYCRLVEWFASNWLCLNMTDFQPYSASNGTYQGADAEANFYDLICDKNLTDGASGGPVVFPSGWPPPGYWYGGGVVCGVQAAVSHEGDASGGDAPDWNDPVQPGNPARVLAAVVAVCPYGLQSGSDWEAPYNVLGVTLGSSDGWDLQYAPDPAASNWTVSWPPPNDRPEARTKFFYGCVSNGYDDKISTGSFQAMWDFDGDGQPETNFANISYTPDDSTFGRLFVLDKNTGRTGVHLVNIFYQ